MGVGSSKIEEIILNFKLKIDQQTVNTVKKVIGIIWWVALALLALLMFSIIGAKLQGRVPEIFGHSVLRIVSGSMGDTIPIDSYILVERVDPEDIRIDDIICFYSSDPAIYGKPNTHRVVKDPVVTDDGIEFVTRGDASNVDDKYTAKGDMLIGRYVKTMDGVTAFAGALDRGGMTVIIFVLEAAIMAMAVCSFLRARKQAMEERENDEKTGEPVFSKEEIEKFMGENPDIVREIEEKMGLNNSSESESPEQAQE